MITSCGSFDRETWIPVDVPVGAVLPYAGPINGCTSTQLAARGWLFCDGSVLVATEYPELYRVIRQLHGFPSGDQGTGFFNLPDLRGVFLRGVNGNATRCDGSPRDPDNAQRGTASCNGTGNKGNAVGSVQLDAFQEHEHDYQAIGSSGTPSTFLQGNDDPLPLQSTATSQVVEQSTSDVDRTSTETRPINVYVNFIIKARSRTRPLPAEVPWCEDTTDSGGGAAAGPGRKEP